jgi:FkbM family methyltransferase
VGLVDKILHLGELEAAPPILVDIGASQAIHPKWRRIARYSVCVAFEPDDRAAGHLTSAKAGFRTLHRFNSVVVDAPAAADGRFYLTRSPYCSSRLRPSEERLADYAFAPLFQVEREVEVNTIELPAALGELGLDRVDWFKADSQGTDLRLFESLDEDVRSRVLVAEFEPGIIDAYEGEDKLAEVMRAMAERNFWLSELTVRGSARVRSELAEATLGAFGHRYLDAVTKTAPGWAEVEYMNDFDHVELFGKREWLLGCLFASLRGHHGFCLELASRGLERFDEPLFGEIRESALRRLRLSSLKVPFLGAAAFARRVLA